MVSVVGDVDPRLISDKKSVAIVDLAQTRTASLTGSRHETHRVPDTPTHHSAISPIQDVHSVVIVDVYRRWIVELRQTRTGTSGDSRHCRSRCRS